MAGASFLRAGDEQSGERALSRRANELVSVPMTQVRGLATISEARANACVSTYSRMFVSLPLRTVMAKTKWSSNLLFVALTFQVVARTASTFTIAIHQPNLTKSLKIS